MRPLTAFVVIALLAAPLVLAVTPTNPGDLNADGVVDVQDVLLVNGQLGKSPLTDTRGDPNNDGKADLFDFILVTKNWGRTYTGGPDVTPPQVTIVTPDDNEVFPSGTTNIPLQVITDEPAICKHHGSNVAFAQMSNTFQTSDSITHTSGTGGLTDGATKTRYILCQDLANPPNLMTQPVTVTFSVSTASAAVCGNGVKEGTEQCDQGASNGACPATCSNSCTTNTCGPAAVCGNGVIETGEQCDGSNLNGQTCQSRGYTGGTLSCNPTTCQFNTAQCTIPPPSTSNPNEPQGVGMSQKCHSDGSSLGQGNWQNNGGITVIADSAAYDPAGSANSPGLAPRSPPSVLQSTYPMGSSNGAHGNEVCKMPAGIKGMYLHAFVQLSSNWQGHDSNQLKLFMAGLGGGRPVIYSMWGKDYGTVRWNVHYQWSTNGGSTPLPPNMYNNKFNSGAIVRGQWHEVEAILVHESSQGAADGWARWWLDGVLVSETTNIPWAYAPTGSNPYDGDWNDIIWVNIWGGTGDTVSETQYVWVDDMYVSATPQYFGP